MRQTEVEKYAFLYLCGKRDRDILRGKIKMKYADFDRLRYLAEVLGLRHYSQEIWNVFAGGFLEQIAELEEVYEETLGRVSYSLEEEDGRQKRWLREFLKNIPDRQARNQMKQRKKETL